VPEKQADTFEYKDQPLDEERGVNDDQSTAALEYSPRERVAPGMVSKNKGESSKVASNKLEPSAHQMEIELVVNSARSN
jgi:hypothetical protein